MPSYTQKAVHGASIVFIIGFLAALVSYITRIILARNLSTTEYGLFFSIFTFVTFILFFRDLGTSHALVKYISHYQAIGKKRLIQTTFISVGLIQIILTIPIAIILLLGNNYLSTYYFKDPNAYNLLIILAIFVILIIPVRILRYGFQGFQKMFLFSLVEFMKNVISLILILIFFALNLGVKSPALAYTFVNLVLFFIFVPFFLKLIGKIRLNKIKAKIIKSTSKKVMLFALPMFATAVGDRMIGYIDTLMLTHFGTLEQVGIYNVIFPTALILLMGGRALSSIVFPVVSELSAKNDVSRLHKGTLLLQKNVMTVTIPLIGVGLVFSQRILDILFGGDYTSGALAFQILLVGIAFFTVTFVNNSILAAIGRPKEASKIIILAVLTNTILNFILIPKYGIEGAAISTTLSYFLTLILSQNKLKGILEIKSSMEKIIILLLPASGFMLTLQFFKNVLGSSILIIICSSFISLFIYSLLIYLFGVVTESDLKKYKRMIWK